MIRNQWYVVLESKEVGRKPMGVKRLGERLVFWRNREGKLSCFADKCVHRGAKLSLGEVKGPHLQCPFHGLEFDATGACRLIPANGKNTRVEERFHMKDYLVFEKSGWVWIFWGDPQKASGEPLFFRDMVEDFPFISRQDPWSAHYSRCVENQLDVSHLPFVHRKTIGRGNATLVDGPLTHWINDSMFEVYVFNRKDDGTPARRPADLQVKPEGAQKLEFIFPNLWQNYLTPKMRIIAAFVPVDEEHSMIYLRFYQRMVTLPLLKQLFHLLFMSFNMRILHEDRHVVHTQQPPKTALVMNENLFQADSPIVEYRKKREELLRQNG